MDLGNGLEEIRPWLGTGGILGCLAFAARMWIANRKLTMAERAAHHAQTLEEEDFERKGYGVLLDAMQEQMKALQASVTDLQKQLGECRAEHASSKRQVSDLTAQVEGLHRQLVMHSQTAAVAMGASEMVVDAGRRATDIVTRREGDA